LSANEAAILKYDETLSNYALNFKLRRQVDPMKSLLKVPGTKRLKLNYGRLLSSFAYKFRLRRYTKGVSWNTRLGKWDASFKVGWCMLTLD